MTFRLAHWYCLMALSVGLGVVPILSLAQSEPGAGRPIEFSEPSSRTTATNSNHLDDRSERLKQLERDLNKNSMNPFENFNPRNSLDGVSARPFYAPSAPPTIQSKKLRELLERRKNWVFMTSDDMTAEPSAAELFNLPEYDENGFEKKEESSLDRFYNSLEKNSKSHKAGKASKAKGGRNGKNENALTSSRDKDRFHEDLEMDPDEPAELQPVRESERALKKMFEAPKAEDHAISPFLKPVTASDVFGLSTTAPTAERSPAQKARLEEFKQLLAPGPSASSSLEPLKPFNAFPSSPVVGGMDTSISRPITPSTVGGFTPPRLPVSAFGGGVTVVPLEGGLRPAGSLTPTRIEPARVNSAVPVFSVPQRKF